MSNWVTQGPEVAAFEREFAAYIGTQHACSVSNVCGYLDKQVYEEFFREYVEILAMLHAMTEKAQTFCHAR